jgi:hypothetical protein
VTRDARRETRDVRPETTTSTVVNEFWEFGTSTSTKGNGAPSHKLGLELARYPTGCPVHKPCFFDLLVCLHILALYRDAGARDSRHPRKKERGKGEIRQQNLNFLCQSSNVDSWCRSSSIRKTVVIHKTRLEIMQKLSSVPTS